MARELSFFTLPTADPQSGESFGSQKQQLAEQERRRAFIQTLSRGRSLGSGLRTDSSATIIERTPGRGKILLAPTR